MMTNLAQIQDKFTAPILMTLFVNLASGCGAKITTGRNADPSKWPTTESSDPAGQPDSPERPSTPGADTTRGETPLSCFEKKASAIPVEIAQFCESNIKPEPAFKDLYPILCEQGKIIASLANPNCGWTGAPSALKSFVHHYYIQKDKTKDYEDIHATAIHPQAPIEKVLRILGLAFGNFDEFKAQGYQWIAGTREQKNLSGTTWDQGVRYRFRADKGEYEIGYQGLMKMYRVSPTLAIHLNYATGDFARIAEFAQIGIYQEHPDHTVVAWKIEHRRISSQGLYDRAKKSAAELVKDITEKGFQNASKP